MFRHFVLPKLQAEIEDWDNQSEDEQPNAGHSESTADCRRICESKPECVQFTLTGRSCRTSNAVKLGSEHRYQRKWDDNLDSPSSVKENEEPQRVISGWLMDRVTAFMDEMDASCQGDDWIAT